MSKISETIGIEVNEEGIRFKAQCDVAKGEVYFKQNDVEEEEKQIAIELREGMVSCSFAVRYLNMFNKYSQFSPTVTIIMGQGTHVVITYPICISEVSEDENIISMYVAKKINEDNN